MVIYAFRRGLSNRPARGTFIASSGPGWLDVRLRINGLGGLAREMLSEDMGAAE